MPRKSEQVVGCGGNQPRVELVVKRRGGVAVIESLSPQPGFMS
jgi:hypothetical protein